jgi:hypothetical protein
MNANRLMRERNAVVFAEQAKRQREAIAAEERKQLEQAETVPPSKPGDEPGPEAA